MKRFLKNILYFTFLLLFINLIFGLLIQYLKYYNMYESVNLNCTSYLLADSHGLPLKNNLEKNNIFNFSAGSESYFDMLRKIKFLISNSKIKRLIITTDDHTLSKYRDQSNNLDRSAKFTTVSDYNGYYDYFINKYLKRYIPFCNPKARDLIKAYLFTPKKQPSLTKQPIWKNLKKVDKIKSALVRADYQFIDNHSSINLINAIESIIDVCRKNKIEIIGIKFPIANEYYPMVEKRSYHADSIFYKKGIRVFNFSKIFDRNDEYFANQDHLNDVGGIVFCNILLDSLGK
jgi:hypothetical protein